MVFPVSVLSHASVPLNFKYWKLFHARNGLKKDLLEIGAKCGKLGLVVKLDKCVSMSFDGLKTKPSCFSLAASSTSLLKANLPKFLVKLLLKTYCPLRKPP